MGATQHQSLLKKYQSLLKSWGILDKEHRDYILCKEIYHCTPEQLDNVDEYTLQLHFAFYNAEKKEEDLQRKRAEQKSSLSHK